MIKVLAFVQRGWLITTSYKLAFGLELLQLLLGMGVLGVLARFVDAGGNRFVQSSGTDYVTFVLIGMGFAGLVTFALHAFSNAIGGEQEAGTLEPLLLAETPLLRSLLGMALWELLTTVLQVAGAVLLLVLLFGVQLNAEVPASLVVLGVSMLATAGLGLLSAGIVLVTKRGDPITWAYGLATSLLGGALVPLDALPEPVRWLSQLLPTTHALGALRETLTRHAGLQQVSGPLLLLILFTAVTLPLGLWVFHWGFERARREGSLAQY